MAIDNPFEVPAAAGGGAALLGGLATEGEAWSEGDRLFTSPECTLPLVCAKCGTTEDVQHVTLKAQWAPMWARLTILLSPIVYLIVFFIVRKRCRVEVGLCGSHRTQRMLGMVGGVGGILVGLGMIFGTFVLEDVALIPIGMFGGLGLLIVGIIAAAVLAMPLRVVRVTNEQAEFKGAHAELLSAVSSPASKWGI